MKSTIINKLLLNVSFICFTAFVAFGQGDSDAVLGANSRNVINSDLQPISRPGSGIKRINIEPTKADKLKLRPSETDFFLHRQFLKESKTGIVKIFPDLKCSPLILDVTNDKCLEIPQFMGNGSFYSFRKRNYEFRWADVHFVNGNLKIVDTSVLGFVINLGDLPIESVNKNTSELSDLLKYQMPETYADLSQQKSSLRNAINDKSSIWSSQAQVKINTTYGLRIASWMVRQYQGIDVDLIVIIRVVRHDEDGSITILWKELQRNNPPKLKV